MRVLTAGGRSEGGVVKLAYRSSVSWVRLPALGLLQTGTSAAAAAAAPGGAAGVTAAAVPASAIPGAEVLVLGGLLALSLAALCWALHSRNHHRRLREYYEKSFYETRDSLDLVATALGQRRFLSLMRLGCERAAAANPHDN